MQMIGMHNTLTYLLKSEPCVLEGKAPQTMFCALAQNYQYLFFLNNIMYPGANYLRDSQIALKF